jgi:hypothetical protein
MSSLNTKNIKNLSRPPAVQLANKDADAAAAAASSKG